MRIERHFQSILQLAANHPLTPNQHNIILRWELPTYLRADELATVETAERGAAFGAKADADVAKRAPIARESFMVYVFRG